MPTPITHLIADAVGEAGRQRVHRRNSHLQEEAGETNIRAVHRPDLYIDQICTVGRSAQQPIQSVQASTCSSASSSPASPGTSPPPPPPPAALSPPPELLRPATAAPFLGWPDVVDADVTGVVLPPPTACPGGDLTPRATLRRSMRGGNMPCSRASRRLAGLPAHGRAETHAGRVKQGGREAALQGNVFVCGGAPRRGMHIDTACPPPHPPSTTALSAMHTLTRSW